MLRYMLRYNNISERRRKKFKDNGVLFLFYLSDLFLFSSSFISSKLIRRSAFQCSQNNPIGSEQKRGFEGKISN